jgi:hypothetical protein
MKILNCKIFDKYLKEILTYRILRPLVCPARRIFDSFQDFGSCMSGFLSVFASGFHSIIYYISEK